MYAIIETRLNIVFAIIVLSRFDINSNKQHLIIAKYIFRYLRNILNIEIIYKDNDVLVDYIDID